MKHTSLRRAALIQLTVCLMGGAMMSCDMIDDAAETTATSDTNSTAPAELDMTVVATEINSLKVEDFAETDQVTEYVKMTIAGHGELVLRLRADVAPITVANFQSLVGDHFYDGLTFHRIMKGFMIQGGASSGSTPSAIKGEFASNGVKNDLSHITGVISMARTTEPNSATSQFFISNDDRTAGSLDGNYAGFGYVVAGLNVLESVSNVEVTYNIRGELSDPVETVVIEKVVFVTKK